MNTTIKHLKWIFILCLMTCTLIPLYFVIGNLSDRCDIHVNIIVINIVFTLLATVLNASAVMLFSKLILNTHYPWHKSKSKRVFIELVSTNMISVAGSSLVFSLFIFTFGKEQMDDFENSLTAIWFQIATISIIINSMSVAVHEGQYLFREWMKSKIETEQLRREIAETQYAALKNQVNPHFLFNSLNSLASLIRMSPDKAIEFVDKFSKIYRYVLDVNEKLVVPLADELAFLQSYHFLQTIRFGENLQLHIHLNDETRNRYVVPLALQLIIENAIKHNEISTAHPLCITIRSTDTHLIITNTLRLRTTLEPSNGIGQKNIIQRYEHLSDLPCTFALNGNQYEAHIPLLDE